MSDLIKIKRGLKQDLPLLALAEFGFTTDTEELYIGGLNGNKKFPSSKDIQQLAVNIEDFGAISSTILGQETFDSTSALEDAIQFCVDNNFTTVFIPKGIYRISSSIEVPRDIEIKGTGIASTPQFVGGQWDKTLYGSVLAIIHGSGLTSTNNSAMKMNSRSIIDGVNFWYPNQSGSTATPTVYPSTFSFLPDSNEFQNRCVKVTLQNIVNVNPYVCCEFTINHELLIIDNLRSSPWYRGLIIDNSTDVNRIYNVHFNPNIQYRADWPSPNVYEFYINNNLTKGFYLGKADACNFNNCFIYGFYKGIECGTISTGIPNGLFFTDCQVEGCGVAFYILSNFRRIVITNCQLANTDDYSSGGLATIDIFDSDVVLKNELKISNTRIFASSGTGINLRGVEDITMSYVDFYNTVKQDAGFAVPVIKVDTCENVLIDGCNFEVNIANLNVLYYNILNSLMVIMQNCKFKNSQGTGSSSQIVSSSYIRIIRPQYNNTNDETTFESGNTDSTITDKISY